MLISISRRGKALRPGSLALIVAGTGFLYALPALADTEPFGVDDKAWSAPSQYLATHKGDAAAAQGPVAHAPAPAPAQSAPDATTASVGKLAEAARPIDIPYLTTHHAHPTARIDSTADHETSPADSSDTAKNAPPPAQGWHDAAAKDDPDNATDPKEALPVRMSYLPSAKNQPQPTPDYVSGSQAARHALAQGLVKQSKAPEQAKACAAINAFQKRQLKDLESDQQTLAALRTAVTSLGLQKQLSFLTEPDQQATPPVAAKSSN